jgi:hypothetical protein
MIHVVVLDCLIGLWLLTRIELLWRSRNGVLKIEESESEVLKFKESELELLCTDSTALVETQVHGQKCVL